MNLVCRGQSQVTNNECNAVIPCLGTACLLTVELSNQWIEAGSGTLCDENSAAKCSFLLSVEPVMKLDVYR